MMQGILEKSIAAKQCRGQRMRPLPNMPSWLGAQLKHKDFALL